MEECGGLGGCCSVLKKGAWGREYGVVANMKRGEKNRSKERRVVSKGDGVW